MSAALLFLVACTSGLDSSPPASDTSPTTTHDTGCPTNWTDAPCSPSWNDHYWCDECGRSWYCSYPEEGATLPTWAMSDVSCDCISIYGLLKPDKGC